ncbi:MAG: ABC transporter permease subunit [Ignavibacteriaceae bacterium]|nr:ABC transporter permease subunit [Ignavibacteriaceae bacterium]
MISLVSIELYKIFKKWRSYIGFLAISVLVPIIQIALLIEGEKYLEFLTQNLQQTFVFVGNLLNGYLIAFIVLGSFWVHIPFLVTLVTGDLLAGEATSGTYRMLITRPVSRLKLVTAKFIAGLIYTHSLVLWLSIVSLVLGIILFGTGELIVIGEKIVIFSKDDIIWRFLLAYGYAALSMSVVASLGFLLSSLVENAIGPIISTMAIIIVFTVLSALNFDFFIELRPYLFTNYMPLWRSFFDDPIDYSEVLKSGFILLGHVISFFGLTIYLFNKKDILS